MSRWCTAVIAGLTALACIAAAPAQAVPEAGHVLIECEALRLNVNNTSVRHQIKVLVTLSSADEDRLAQAKDAWMTITRPDGNLATVGNHSLTSTPKQFKTAVSRLAFKVITDSASVDNSTVGQDFFNSLGPYLLSLAIGSETYTGEVSFGEPLTMEARQEGKPVKYSVLRDEAGLDLYTAPETFGPVYYKHRDMANFVFQLANMDNALGSDDYHLPVESPRYLFQVRISDGKGGPARLVNPERYIDGYQQHMIRSDETSTPLRFLADEFSIGDAVVIDFQRKDTLTPDTVFAGSESGLSSNVVITDRVMYVLSVEPPPTSAELGLGDDQG